MCCISMVDATAINAAMIKISKLLFFISYNLLAKEMFSAYKAILSQINVIAPFYG